MRTSLIALSVALMLPFGAMAQSTDTTTEDTATEDAATENTSDAPDVGSAIEDQLSLGEDASLPQVGQTYTKETNGDWQLRCHQGRRRRRTLPNVPVADRQRRDTGR